MAVLKVCCVFDEKAEAYMNPFFVPALGIATRDFTDSMTDKGSKQAKYKSDFKLYHVAEFDTSTAAFECIQPPRLILSGSDIECIQPPRPILSGSDIGGE